MNVAIIDYGSGNLRSATKAFEQAFSEIGGGTIKLTRDPDGLKNFSHIVLPGVGAFSDCMTRLSAIDGLIESLQEQVLVKAKPFLGICVGMQLMADVGREHGKTDGLAGFPGKLYQYLLKTETSKSHIWVGTIFKLLTQPIPS